MRLIQGFPGGSDGKESTHNTGDLGLIPGLGRSPGEGNDNPFQYSCLMNPMDRGASWAVVHGVTELHITEHVYVRVRAHTHTLAHRQSAQFSHSVVSDSL